jgi:hypothetical protein
LSHRHWEQQLSVPSLLAFEPSPPPTSLSFVRTGLDGRVTGYTEARFRYGPIALQVLMLSHRPTTLVYPAVSRQLLWSAPQGPTRVLSEENLDTCHFGREDWTTFLWMQKMRISRMEDVKD